MELEVHFHAMIQMVRRANSRGVGHDITIIVSHVRTVHFAIEFNTVMYNNSKSCTSIEILTPSNPSETMVIFAIVHYLD